VAFVVLPAASQVIISEILFDGNAVSAEFVEFKNVGSSSVDLINYHISGGVAFIFAGTTPLAPGGFAVLSGNETKFQEVYHRASDGQFVGKLGNNGDNIVVTNAIAQQIYNMTYNDKAPWPPASNGFSLVTANPSSNPTPQNPFSWRTSTFVGGTPYRDDTGPTAPVDPSYANIRLTEIMYNPASNPSAEFLELKNVGSSSINMTNLRLVDGVDYVFPNNILLAAGAFYVITANTTAFQLRYSRAPSGQYTGKLSSTGDRVALYDIFGNDVLNVTYNDKSPWPGGPAQGIGLSLVLISPNSDESDPKSWRTSKSIHGSPFADDAPTGPLDTTLSVLKLTEIMYSPRTLNGYSSADLEFLELKNTGSSAVDLSGSAVVDGVYFVFPPSSMVQPGAFFVLATNATDSTTDTPDNQVANVMRTFEQQKKSLSVITSATLSLKLPTMHLLHGL